VLADPKFNNEQNKNQVASLTVSFNQEISTAKNQLSRLTVATTTDNSVVSIADNSKDNKGLSVATNPLGQTPNYITTSSAISTSTKKGGENIKGEGQTATSSSAGGATSTLLKADTSNSDTATILDQAQKLFDQKDYDQAFNKLKEADQFINAAN